MLLLAVEVDFQLRQIVVFKVEWIFLIVSVEGVLVHASDDETRWQLTGKEVFLTAIQVTTGHGKRLADDASYGVFGVTVLECFSVGEKD